MPRSRLISIPTRRRRCGRPRAARASASGLGRIARPDLRREEEIRSARSALRRNHGDQEEGRRLGSRGRGDATLCRARPAPPRGARPARGRASRRRSRARRVEELDRARIAAVLAADAHLELRAWSAARARSPSRTSWPTPDWSRLAKGSSGRIPSRCRPAGTCAASSRE